MFNIGDLVFDSHGNRIVKIKQMESSTLLVETIEGYDPMHKWVKEYTTNARYVIKPKDGEISALIVKRILK